MPRLVIALVTGLFAVLLAGVLVPTAAMGASHAYAYDSPSSMYDGATHSVQVHTSAAELMTGGNVFDEVQGTAVSATGPFSVMLLKSVAANSGDHIVLGHYPCTSL